MRLADIVDIENPRGHEVMTADIADLDQMQRACEGMDTVVHLAADRSPAADFYENPVVAEHYRHIQRVPSRKGSRL